MAMDKDEHTKIEQRLQKQLTEYTNAKTDGTIPKLTPTKKYSIESPSDV